MQVDIIGIDDVLKYIEATKLSKFTVQRQNGAGYIPCFECLDSETNANAVNEFSKWATIIKNNMPYKLSVFDVAEVIMDANGNEKIKKSSKRSGKMECTFILNQGYNNVGSNKNEPIEHFDTNDFRKQVIKEIAEQNEKNEILNEIREMKKRFAELDEEEDEEPVEDGSIGGISGNQISQIMGLVNLFKQQTNPSLNGIAEPNIIDINIQKDNINKAIKILYKNNKQLDTDLLKLAELSETKKETFTMLLQTLRNM
jgi:hypothetical protein